MKLRLILSLFLIAAVSTTAFASTQALLSDQVTLSANTFSTGTADLQIAKGTSGTFTETLVGFTETLLPGQTKSQIVRLKNNSADVEFAIAAQASNVVGIPGDKVTVAFTPWTTMSLTSGVMETGASTTSRTLADWESSPASLGTPNIDDGDTQNYKMDVTIDETVVTSGSSSFDFTFTGTQVDPTP